MPNENRFGRRYAPDPRDANHPMRRLLEAAPPPTLPVSRYWIPGRQIDQQGGSCTGAAAAGLLMASPIRVPAKQVDYLAIYKRAQELDEFNDTPPSEGSTVRAAMKALKEMGRVSEYLWADMVEQVVQWILTRGPVVAGTDWRTGMMTPDPRTGIITYAGLIEGGHAYLLDGASRATRLLRIRNSWGSHWGKNGHAWISFEDFGLLLADQGEAATATETAL